MEGGDFMPVSVDCLVCGGDKIEELEKKGEWGLVKCKSCGFVLGKTIDIEEDDILTWEMV